MTDPFVAYERTRARIVEVVDGAVPDTLGRMVPACPEWTAKDLIGHAMSMPVAIGAGDTPTGSIDDWIQGLVEQRRDQPVDELITEWLAADEAIATLLSGHAVILLGDLAVHEHDLRGALDAPDHDALEVDVILPRMVAAFAKPLRAAALGSIEVRDDGHVWRSHDAPPGWVLEVSAWEAVRALNSRRTPDELRALPHSGDVDPYLRVLDDHLPLPVLSLQEP
jgi:hypothetical protein